MKLNTTTALLFLFALPFVFFFPYIFQSPQPLILPNSTLGTDLSREILPTATYIQQELSLWHSIPLWRPYILSGAPLAGHPVYPLLYPFFWMIAILPVNLALNLMVVLHLGWAAAGVFIFIRQVTRVSHQAALAGAMFFAFSPKIVAHVSGGHWSMMMALAWLPWAWLFFHKYWQTEQWKWIPLLGICFWMQILTDLRTLYITVLLLIILSIAKNKKPLLAWLVKFLKLWGVSGMLAAGLGAGQLLPFVELWMQSSRTALSLNEASFGSLHPALLISSLFPPILKMPEFYIYMGVSALLFGLIAIQNTHRKEIRPYLVLLLFATIISLGGYTPLYKAFFYAIPGFSFLRVPARWWFIVLFLLAMVASIGIEKWLNNWQEIRKRSAPILIALGLFYLTGLIFWLLFPDLMPFEPLVACIEFGLLCILFFGRPWFSRYNPLIVIILFGLWLPATSLLQPVTKDVKYPVESDIIKILENGAQEGERSFTPYGYGNIPQAFQPELLAADGYDSFHLKSYQDLVEKMIGCDFSGYSVSVPALLTNPEAAEICPSIDLDQRLAKLLNIRFLLLPEDHSTNQGTLLATENGINLIDLGKPYGLAFGVGDFKLIDSNSCLEELEKIDPQKTALIDEQLAIDPAQEMIQVTEGTKINNGMQFQARSKAPFLLVRSETWAPGWSAFDESGHKLEVMRVNCALQGVVVEKGEHTIRFEYRPLLWVAGIIVSGVFAISLSILVVGWILRRMMHRRENQD